VRSYTPATRTDSLGGYTTESFDRHANSTSIRSRSNWTALGFWLRSRHNASYQLQHQQQQHAASFYHAPVINYR